MNCKICKTITTFSFRTKILNKYNVAYNRCPRCGFLFSEDPYWLKEAYDAPICRSDTGILGRNLHFSKVSSVLIYFTLDPKGIFQDYAAGYGIFVRLMRDIGFDFCWSDKYSANLVARGFNCKEETKHYEAITSFELLEHLENPIATIGEILKKTDTLIFSTELLPDKISEMNDWWYFNPEEGQHISFYSLETLKFLSISFHAKLITNKKNFHILTRRNLSFSFIHLLMKLNRLLFPYVKLRMNSLMTADYEIIVRK